PLKSWRDQPTARPPALVKSWYGCVEQERMRFRAITRFLSGPLGLICWGCAVAAGIVGMVRYQVAAAPPTIRPPANWPANSLVRLDASRPTLVMSLHPHCPCSRASVRELSVL